VNSYKKVNRQKNALKRKRPEAKKAADVEKG
jgi:hypothetical protein